MSQTPPTETPSARPAADLSTPRTYAQNRVVRIAWPAICVILLGTTVAMVVLDATGAWREAAEVPFLPLLSMLLGVATLWLLLVSVSVNRRIRVDERGITRLGLFGRGRRIDWGGVKELTLGGTATFAEGALGTKLFVEGRDGTLITFTSRLNGLGELIEIIEGRTGLAFTTPDGEAILPIADEKPDDEESGKQ